MFTFSIFWLEIHFLARFGPKIQNCLFKVKFNTQCKSNMQNSIVIFTFRPETLFLGIFCPSNRNCQFKLKFGTQTNSNMQNSVVFTFSACNWKYPFWANLIQKTVSFSQNLLIRLIRIFRIQSCCPLFPFSTGKLYPENLCGILMLPD